MKRSRIKQVSSKRQREQKIYTRERNQFMAEHPRCQCRPDGENQCGNQSTECHHRKGRLEYYLRVDTFMACCQGCHEKIEQERDWAKEMGYLLNRASNNPIPPLHETA